MNTLKRLTVLSQRVQLLVKKLIGIALIVKNTSKMKLVN